MCPRNTKNKKNTQFILLRLKNKVTVTAKHRTNEREIEGIETEHINRKIDIKRLLQERARVDSFNFLSLFFPSLSITNLDLRYYYYCSSVHRLLLPPLSPKKSTLSPFLDQRFLPKKISVESKVQRLQH